MTFSALTKVLALYLQQQATGQGNVFYCSKSLTKKLYESVLVQMTSACYIPKLLLICLFIFTTDILTPDPSLGFLQVQARRFFAQRWIFLLYPFDYYSIFLLLLLVIRNKRKCTDHPSRSYTPCILISVLTVALKSRCNCMPMQGIMQRPAYIIVSAVLAEVAPDLVLHYNSAPAPPSHVACACVLQSQLCVSWVGRSASADARDLFSEGRQLFNYFQINAKRVGFESS